MIRAGSETNLSLDSPDSTGKPLIDVVMVTYGRADLVERCLRSLTSKDMLHRVRVTVVDNNSPDHTPEMIRRDFPEVRLLARGDNPGFAVANNQALRLVTSPHVLVLNPDTEVSWPTLEALVREMENEPDIGVLGCRLMLLDGTFDHASKRFIPTPLQALIYFASRLVGRKAGRYVAQDLAEDGYGDVDAVNGAFMLIRTSAMREVGLLEERYWMYGEDLDWCVRFRKHGWRVVYDGRYVALHIKGGSSNQRRSFRLNYHFHRSMAIFYGQHLAPVSSWPVNVIVNVAIWARFVLIQTSNTVKGLTSRFSQRG